MTGRKIQLMLTCLGYDPGQADGILGKQTRAAVLAFQRDWGGLTEDGTPGPVTQAALRQAVFDDWEKPESCPAQAEEKTGTWWDDIRYFSREDPHIGCPCGACDGFPAEPSEKLMRLADAVRTQAGRPMIPTSTVRCAFHNAKVGGVGNSRHLLGNAMDFYIPGLSAQEILSIVRKQKDTAYCYAIDGSAVHMDVV